MGNLLLNLVTENIANQLKKESDKETIKLANIAINAVSDAIITELVAGSIVPIHGLGDIALVTKYDHSIGKIRFFLVITPSRVFEKRIKELD